MEFIALRFVGNDVAPSNTRCKEVAALIVATEELIRSIEDGSGDDEDDEEDAQPEPLCLIDIENKSLGLKFTKEKMVKALVAWQIFATVVTERDFSRVPPKATSCLSEIVSFIKRRGCNLELSDSAHSAPIACITPDFQIPADIKITGTTSLIGTVLRVGGSEPKVRLKLANGKTLTCDTSVPIAQELGHRLYEVVSCKGDACWDLGTNNLIRFKIKEVGSFRESKASDAFAALAEAMPITVSQWTTEGIDKIFKDNET